ncbi:protein FAM135A-like [Xenopus laevis]|uniref:Protein FAM135A-like n=1 Tax=Xenopus laevis TaxID=8355 RepID=A0A8J1MU27_XENLA|nr:protein FAM135A-like [Xenopus laevis]
MMLDNDSNEGISVNIRMRPNHYQHGIITFVYGCLGGRTAVIGHQGNKHETLAEYDSLANRLLSQIARLIESNSLIISRMRLFDETSEKKLILEQLIPTEIVYQSSSTGSKDKSSSEDDGTHLIVCVHGLGGSERDLRPIRPYIESGVTHEKIDFLMSRCNMHCTVADIDYLASRLLNEILAHITSKKLIISRISFIGFSLGNLIIRSALWRPEFEGYLGNLHTFLSFGGPHMGLLYHSRFLFKIGLQLQQQFDSSVSISQMAFTDHKDPRQRFLYKLSQKTGLEHFKNVILVSALQDYIVPYHSTRIEMCKDAVKGSELGTVYSEMLRNVLEPVLNNKNCNLVRYDVSFDLPKSVNYFIGATGHCALISSWQFLENFFQNAGLKYFE